MLTVDGTAEFTQHLLTGSNSKYTIWLNGNNLEGTNVEVGLATDCAAAPANYVVSVEMISSMIFIFYIFLFF